MVEQAVDQRGGLAVRLDQPLIGIILQEDDERVVRYFADEAAADAAIPERATQQALSAIGSWSDLDFDETLDALDRIRHESTPTPPIDLEV